MNLNATVKFTLIMLGLIFLSFFVISLRGYLKGFIQTPFYNFPECLIKITGYFEQYPHNTTADKNVALSNVFNK